MIECPGNPFDTFEPNGCHRQPRRRPERKQTYAVIQLAAHGWGPDQFGCLNNIWIRESGWNELAGNPARAYGIPQAYPGSKMAAEGSDWLTNPQTQIRWGEDYIQSRYGTPCQAWAFWQARRYYGPLLAVVPF